jgi:serine/threonine protein kinase
MYIYIGKTYKMRNKIDCEMYAVKMIKVKKMQKSGVAVEALKREVHMLLQLNSPYIVR